MSSHQRLTGANSIQGFINPNSSKGTSNSTSNSTRTSTSNSHRTPLPRTSGYSGHHSLLHGSSNGSSSGARNNRYSFYENTYVDTNDNAEVALAEVHVAEAKRPDSAHGRVRHDSAHSKGGVCIPLIDTRYLHNDEKMARELHEEINGVRNNGVRNNETNSTRFPSVYTEDQIVSIFSGKAAQEREKAFNARWGGNGRR